MYEYIHKYIESRQGFNAEPGLNVDNKLKWNNKKNLKRNFKYIKLLKKNFYGRLSMAKKSIKENKVYNKFGILKTLQIWALFKFKYHLKEFYLILKCCGTAYFSSFRKLMPTRNNKLKQIHLHLILFMDKRYSQPRLLVAGIEPKAFRVGESSTIWTNFSN